MQNHLEVKEEGSKMSYLYLPVVKPIHFRYLPSHKAASQQELTELNSSIQQIDDDLASNRYYCEGDQSRTKQLSRARGGLILFIQP